MSHTCGNILLHFIFSTAGRSPLIAPEFRDDLFAYMGGIVRGMRATALIVNGKADHVHILARIRPAQSAAEMARVTKANSSGWVRGQFKADFAWQTGYAAFSVSDRMSPRLRNIFPVRRNITGSIRYGRSSSRF